MKKTIVGSYTRGSSNFVEYVDYIDGELYRANCAASGNTPDTFRIEVDPSAFDGLPYSVSIKTELESDGESNYIYFLPVISFPRLDTAELDFADSASYYLSKWEESIRKLTKIMFDNPYVQGI